MKHMISPGYWTATRWIMAKALWDDNRTYIFGLPLVVVLICMCFLAWYNHNKMPPGHTDDNYLTLPDGTKCGPEGTAKAKPGKDIDRLKNRNLPPTEAQIDQGVTLLAMLNPGDDIKRFDESKGARVSGLVIDAKVGGVETCNCRTKDPAYRDTHIELAIHPDALSTERVIVEVTPRFRSQMKEKGIDWSTKALHDTLKGKWVEVTGWLMFDWPHIGNAENTNPDGKGNWRATCWEIHPISSIKMLSGPPTNELLPAPAALELAQVFHQLALNDAKRKAIEERNRLVKLKYEEDKDDDMPK